MEDISLHAALSALTKLQAQASTKAGQRIVDVIVAAVDELNSGAPIVIRPLENGDLKGAELAAEVLKEAAVNQLNAAIQSLPETKDMKLG